MPYWEEGFGIPEEKDTPNKRLKKIAKIIERVDNRCMTHAIVTPTLEEMTQEEISEIYTLANV